MRPSRYLDVRRHVASLIWLSLTLLTVILVIIRPLLVSEPTTVHLTHPGHTHPGHPHPGHPGSVRPQKRQSDVLLTDDSTMARIRERAEQYFEKPKSWTPPVLPLRMRSMKQEHPDLLKHIRNHWILPPSGRALKLENPDVTDFSKAKQSKTLDDYLQHKRGGFYVEVGASSGEKASKSLYFERERGWTGLLVEPDIHMFHTLLAKYRNSYTVNTCVAPGSKPMWLNFTSWDVMGGLTDYLEHPQQYDMSMLISSPIQCLPLYSLLAAMGAPHVHLLSINTEGSEMAILRSIPYNKLDIDVFIMDMDLTTEIGKQRAWNMAKLLGNHGYKRILPDLPVDLIMSKL